MSRQNKSYRFTSETVERLAFLVKGTGLSETAFLEWAIGRLHQSMEIGCHTRPEGCKHTIKTEKDSMNQDKEGLNVV